MDHFPEINGTFSGDEWTISRRYMDRFPEINVPFSNVPVYVKTRNKDEEFYVVKNNISTRLSPRQQIKYIKENFEE